MPRFWSKKSSAKQNNDPDGNTLKVNKKQYHELIFKAKDVSTEAPYVILVGKVGTGKSTIVEKLTGVKGRRSNSKESFTKETEYLWVKDKSFLIADTPGTNSRKERLEHNLEIASAINFRAVSKVFFVVKAAVRLDQTIDDVNQFSENFNALPNELFGILVTHMDIKKEWHDNEMKDAAEKDFGITSVIFSGHKTKKSALKKDILSNCGKPEVINITSEVFLRCFKFNSGNKREILKVTARLVSKFVQYKESFEKEKQRLEREGKFTVDEITDLFFEYKAFMELQVEKAKKRFCESLNFDFCQDDATNIKYASYMANMVNQLRAIISDIRITALKYGNDHGCSDIRKCPYCDCIWARVQDCDGWTTCGNLPPTYSDKTGYQMASFRFQTLEDGDLRIEKSGTKMIEGEALHRQLRDVAQGTYTLEETQNHGDEKLKNMRFMRIPEEYQYLMRGQEGCGRLVNWKTMTVVKVPREFELKDENHVTTDDILSLPEEAKSVYDALDKTLKSCASN